MGAPPSGAADPVEVVGLEGQPWVQLGEVPRRAWLGDLQRQGGLGGAEADVNGGRGLLLLPPWRKNMHSHSGSNV